MRSLVWFRGKDLRVSDHEPLLEAAAAGELLCLFVLDPYFFAPERAAKLPHRMQFLLESLGSLAKNLERLGSRLLFARGKSHEVVPRLARRWEVDRVVAHRWSEPFGEERDRRVRAALSVPFDLFEGETLAPWDAPRTKEGKPFSVFTPFARAFRESVTVRPPRRAPRSLPPPPPSVRGEVEGPPDLAELGLTYNARLLPGGEKAARERLSRFLRGPASRYPGERDRMDLPSTSRLSVDLKFGTLSPREVWNAAERALRTSHREAWASFSNELLWRDFAFAVLRADPALLERPHRRSFEDFPWEKGTAGWKAWVRGETGYPVVDASARQLLGEGFVHNRARMISASFLTKHLRIDYRRGEAHYMSLLTDGDWASNNFGWQWTTGCGFDAAPYFRVFHPIEQGKRFDPDGDYVRRWVPELARLPKAHLHEPWKAPEPVLREAGIALGKTYPLPIVDHREARTRYLAIMQERR